MDPGGTADIAVTSADSPITITQDVYSWMSARVFVFEHPWFATTGREGTFTIADVPVGTHALRAWHEFFGDATATVTVRDGETTEVELHLQRP